LIPLPPTSTPNASGPLTGAGLAAPSVIAVPQK
jgi:hypothetical protein